jgi:hypothetical protein
MNSNMVCPRCGGETWDNRKDKRNPKAPDFRCRIDECARSGGVIWPPRQKRPMYPNQMTPKPQMANPDSELIRMAVDLVCHTHKDGNLISDELFSALNSLKLLQSAKLPATEVLPPTGTEDFLLGGDLL